MRTWDMWKVYLRTLRNNRCWKLACFLRNLQASRVNNSRILRIKIAKFSGYCFYVNTNIQIDFQICISLPLRAFIKRFEAPQKSMKIESKLIFSLCPGSGWEGLILINLQGASFNKILVAEFMTESLKESKFDAKNVNTVKSTAYLIRVFKSI